MSHWNPDEMRLKPAWGKAVRKTVRVAQMLKELLAEFKGPFTRETWFKFKLLTWIPERLHLRKE
jgi:hypothetical protein